MRWDETETEADSEGERLLMRYRPIGPPAALRARAWAAAAPRESGWATAGWAAAAAAVFLSLALDAAAGQLRHDALQDVGRPALKWTPAAEEMAGMIGGGAAGRAYLSLTLAVGHAQYASDHMGMGPRGSGGGTP
jgi:hypothetical protein